MYRQAPYHEISGPNGHLAKRREFDGNSMSARWHGDVYLVKSYSTIIAESPRDRRKAATVNYTYYSRTTRSQQNRCLAWLPNRRVIPT